jgi:hypothetical protein
MGIDYQAGPDMRSRGEIEKRIVEAFCETNSMAEGSVQSGLRKAEMTLGSAGF